MRTLPQNATDDEIKKLIVEWSELLAEEKYQDALDMFPFSTEEIHWTADELKRWIVNYGSPEPVFGEPPRRITSILNRNDAREIIEAKIDVDRQHLFGLDPHSYVGMVHYNDVPLDGERSDLTARFNIRKIGEQRITLEFLDIHVM